MARTITKIEARVDPFTRLPQGCSRKRRVAAYARVSTDEEEQQTSYEAQVDYYTRLIKARPDWEFAGVYTDEGISGTNTKRRDGFNRMIRDALDGRIDLIVTKSVSRFARNTVDSLVNIRKLKEHNVECYFEKENIRTFDSKGELLITIMSSLAQEESRSISQNVTWGQRKRFADGKVSFAYARFLGYRKGEDGRIEIDEGQAATVRRIYSDFMAGKSSSQIASEMNAEGVGSPSGHGKWTKTTVLSILRNEKYKGDALLQKTFTVDFLQHRSKKNEGEVPQYYVRDSHPAIIPREDWELVQAEIERRQAMKASFSRKNPFAGKLVCGDCGGIYGRKKWHSGGPHEKTVLQCDRKFSNGCLTPNLDEDAVKGLFVKAYNGAVAESGEILSDLEVVRASLFRTGELDAAIEKVEERMRGMEAEFSMLVRANASAQQDQEAWRKRYSELEDRYAALESERKGLVDEKEGRERKAQRLDAFAEVIRKGRCLEGWDPGIFNLTVEKAVANRDGSVTFDFLSGYSKTLKVGE